MLEKKLNLTNEEMREIRQRFGDGVSVTDRLPTPKEIVERGSWLELIAGTVGLEKWMWKSRRGLLIAIIVVPPGISGLVGFWGPPIRTGIEYARPYISIFEETGLKLDDRMVAFLPEPTGDTGTPAQDAAILAPTVGSLMSVTPGKMAIDATVYRLAHARFDGLDGRGTTNFGGRWNSPGSRLLYTSDSILVAVEELRRHLPLETIRTFTLHGISRSCTS